MRLIPKLVIKPIIRPGRDRFLTGFHKVSKFETSIACSSLLSNSDVVFENLNKKA